MKKLLFPIMMAILMVFPIIPMTAAPASAQTDNGTVVTGDTLNGVKVRFRPAGSHKPLSINQDGDGSQNCVHLYYNGKSSHFYLQKADDDSYYINFYKYYTDAKPKTSGDCRLDVERSGGTDDSYYREGQVIHVVSGSSEAMNKRWQLIQQDDGTYYIRNKRSQLYWSLDDLSKPKTNNNKLVQREEPLKWEMEIVSDDNEKLKTIKPYDSTNFNYNDKPVTSLNWMGALPDNLRITDISIPGTHDAGTCWVHSDQDHSSDQRYYINELLNAGVRHLDIRTGLDGDKKIRIVHSDHHCLDKEGNDISMDELMGWITDFLKKNKTETVVFQVKMDKQGSECERKTFEYLKAMAQKENSYIWTGDHVPTLKEVRGKIVIISRLDLEDLGGEEKGYTFKTTLDGKPALWGLDCHNWRESKDHATDLAASGADFEVWTQDDFGHMAGEKKKYIKGALLGTDDRGNSTLDRYIDAKLNGKHAWVFNYTSTSSGQKHVPFDLCKEIHQWLYDRSEYDNPEKLVCGDTFTGVMAFDFIDEYMASFIYKTNFRRSYTTIHGISPDGEELVRPLTLYVGESEDAAKLLNETYTNILKKHFNANPYGMMAAANGSYLADVKTKNQEELDSAAARVSATLAGGTVPKALYVTLLKPIEQVELDVSMPVCGSAVSGDNSQVRVTVNGQNSCKATSAYITEAGSDTAFEGVVEGGTNMPVLINLAPNWGYRFADDCTVKSDSLLDANCEVISGGQLKVRASAQIPHDTSLVSETPASCTKNGAIEHYECNHCHRIFLGKTAKDGTIVLVETDENEITIPKLGHDWGDWEVTTPATEAEKGELTRECQRAGCDAEETLLIPKTNHVHGLTPVEAEDAEDCTKSGHIKYWVCDSGETPCGSYFADEEATTQISESDTITGPGEHQWGQVKYFGGMKGAYTVVTAVRECENDDSHYESETVVASIDRLEPTCLEDGYLHTDAVFENEALGEYHNHDITYPALGHKWDAGTVTKEPTCNAKGERLFTCERCGETRTEEIAIDPNAHSLFTEEDESTNTATCTEAGRETVYEVCSICDEIVKTKRINTSPLDHSWGTPTYVWSDDKSSVTATRSCERDGCSEEETETVTARSYILSLCSFDADGIIRYDAQFENEEFDTQETVGTIPKVTDARLSQSSYPYDGKAKEPEVTLTDADGNQIDASNYSVTYLNNTNIGTATATVTLIGDRYEGLKNLTFTIVDNTSPPAETFTVTFVDGQGNTLKTETVEKGQAATAPTDPTREGFTFDGWDKDFSNITADLTVTAKWKENAAPGSDPNQMGKDGTAVGEGASAAAADKAITSMKNDKDPKGAVFSKLTLKSPKQTKASIKLNWKKDSKAKKYVIYGNKCGKNSKPKKLVTVTGSAKTFKKVSGKKLKKGTYYKFIIVALDKNNNVVSTSKLIHVAAKGGKVGNHKSVTVKKAVITKAKKLKKGKSLKLKAKAVKQSKKLKVKKHVGLRYESSNEKIATVSSKGVVKAKQKGTCYVYAYAQNGVFKKIKVTVK